MKKYIVTLDNDSVEIEVENLTESSVMSKVEDRFSLIGNFGMELKYIPVMDIHTLTLTKRGTNKIILIKEIVKDNKKEIFDENKFLNEIDSLLNGEIIEVILSNIRLDTIKSLLENKGLFSIDDDYDSDSKTFYFCHKDWEVKKDSGEYCNRLNVVYYINDSSIDISLEDDYEVIARLNELKININSKNKDLEEVYKRIEETKSLLQELECESQDLEDEIASIEDDFDCSTYY